MVLKILMLKSNVKSERSCVFYDRKANLASPVQTLTSVWGSPGKWGSPPLAVLHLLPLSRCDVWKCRPCVMAGLVPDLSLYPATNLMKGRGEMGSHSTFMLTVSASIVWHTYSIKSPHPHTLMVKWTRINSHMDTASSSNKPISNDLLFSIRELN